MQSGGSGGGGMQDNLFHAANIVVLVKSPTNDLRASSPVLPSADSMRWKSDEAIKIVVGPPGLEPGTDRL